MYFEEQSELSKCFIVCSTNSYMMSLYWIRRRKIWFRLGLFRLEAELQTGTEASVQGLAVETFNQQIAIRG